MRYRLVILLALLLSPFATLAKDKPPSQKTYVVTTQSRVYAAMVHAAGSTMTTTVESACTVNFRFGRSSSGFYTIVRATATCYPQADGSVIVTLSAQSDANQFGEGRFRDDGLRTFWSNMDRELGQ